MTLEAYDLCPGGTGNRIKRCQCRDILGDLNQILRALEGGQRVAALDQINRLLATRANRACLLALKCGALLRGNQLQELEETVLTFLRIAPENTLALSYATILNAVKGNAPSAIQTLQKALANTRDRMPYELYEAIEVVAQVLLRRGHYVAARGHFVLQASITKNEEAVERLLQITRDDQFPALFKQDYRYATCAADFRWQAEFAAARELALRGAWQAACDQFDAIAVNAPDEPCVLRNIAICRSLLADPAAPAAWHRYASLNELDEDDAIEAESLAQLLAGDAAQDVVPLVQVTLEIEDTDSVMEKLLSAPTVKPASPREREGEEDDSPPPKAVFVLLDQPAPTDAEFPAERLPAICGRIRVFGKQTDRAARLEFIGAKTDQWEGLLETVRNIIGNQGATSKDEQVITNIPALRAMSFEGFYLVPTTDSSVLKRMYGLREERLGQIIIETWPSSACTSLDGKTPLEVATDPAYRIRLLGALLTLRQLGQLLGWPDVMDQLRTRLGFSPCEPIDPGDGSIDELPLARRHRVRVSALSDDALLTFFEQAQMFGLKPVIENAAREVLARESLKSKVPRAAVYGILAQLSGDVTKRLEYLHEARSAAVAAGTSPAKWMLAELPIRLQLGDSEKAKQILTQLQTRHMNEPGIAAELYELFRQLGILDQQGAQTKAPDPGASDSDASPEGGPWPADASEPSAAELSETPAEPKSKLWLPGQD